MNPTPVTESKPSDRPMAATGAEASGTEGGPQSWEALLASQMPAKGVPILGKTAVISVKQARSGNVSRTQIVPFRKALAVSIGTHIIGPPVLAAGVFLLLLIASWLFQFNFWDWFKAKDHPPDMVFTLVKDTNAEMPEKAHFKGAFNQKAGGVTNKKQPLAPPEAASSPAPRTDTPPAQKQTPLETAAKPAQAPLTPAIPTPDKKAPEPDATANKPEPEPVAKSGPAEIPAGNPEQMLAAIDGKGINIGELSNPETGNAPEPGVNVRQDPDFGPFLQELNRRLKRNWQPPRGAESRKVEVLFFIARDGKVVKIETTKSSGSAEIDKSAELAILASAPFALFPPEVKEDILPIAFTFDYNVLNSRKKK